MGEEYGEPAPFLSFTSHGDRALAEAVSRGRRKEFEAFAWAGEVPDPQAPATFEASKLHRELEARPPHAQLRAFYQALLALRREEPALGPGGKSRLAAYPAGERALALVRRSGSTSALVLLNLGPAPPAVHLRLPARVWTPVLDSREARFSGPGESERGSENREPVTVKQGGPVGLDLPAHTARVYLRRPVGRASRVGRSSS